MTRAGRTFVLVGVVGVAAALILAALPVSAPFTDFGGDSYTADCGSVVLPSDADDVASSGYVDVRGGQAEDSCADERAQQAILAGAIAVAALLVAGAGVFVFRSPPDRVEPDQVKVDA